MKNSFKLLLTAAAASIALCSTFAMASAQQHVQVVTSKNKVNLGYGALDFRLYAPSNTRELQTVDARAKSYTVTCNLVQLSDPNSDVRFSICDQNPDKVFVFKSTTGSQSQHTFTNVKPYAYLNGIRFAAQLERYKNDASAEVECIYNPDD